MSNVQNGTAELDDLANKIKVNLQKSDNMYITAGQFMLKAQELCKANGLKWADWLKANDIKRSKASVCLQIASGKKTVDEVREDAAARQKKHKDALKKKAAKADAADPDEDGDDEGEGMTADHKAMIKAIAKFIQVASPDVLAKMCKAFKISI
jgi:protein required for attachment to host cells